MVVGAVVDSKVIHSYQDAGMVAATKINTCGGDDSEGDNMSTEWWQQVIGEDSDGGGGGGSNGWGDGDSWECASNNSDGGHRTGGSIEQAVTMVKPMAAAKGDNGGSIAKKWRKTRKNWDICEEEKKQEEKTRILWEIRIFIDSH